MVNILGFGLRKILNISTIPWKIYDIGQVIWFIYLFVYKVKIIYCIHNNVRLLWRLNEIVYSNVSITSVQSLSRVWLFVNPWTAARQASLSITNSQNLHKLMSIKSAMSPNHLILCRPLLPLPSIFPSIRSFPVSQFFTSGSQSIGTLAWASVLPMIIQDFL